MTPALPSLRALASAATPGPWYAADRSLTVRTGDWPKHTHPCGTARPVASCSDPDTAFRESVGMGTGADDCAFIAAANPSAILHLLDRLAAAEAVVEAASRVAEFADEQSFTYETNVPCGHDFADYTEECAKLRDAMVAFDRLAGQQEGA